MNKLSINKKKYLRQTCALHTVQLTNITKPELQSVTRVIGSYTQVTHAKCFH